VTPRIPIANIYYLYCYAWDRFDEGRALSTGVHNSPDLPNLLARVLLNGMRALLRRGLDRAYQLVEEELATVRGQIELGPSLRLQARNVRLLQCAYDELSHDVLHNQILKATLKRLCLSQTLARDLSADIQHLLKRLPEVTDIRLTRP